MTDDTIVVVDPPSPVEVVVTGVETVAVVQVPQPITVIESGIGGGAAVDPSLFFQVLLYLAELDNETKKHTARTNLGLETVDGGVFT